jgi:hypothetical protein
MEPMMKACMALALAPASATAAVAAPLPSNDEGEERVSTVASHGR